MPADNILIIAGEVSGDLHAAPVVSELKKLNPELSFWGTGGNEMRAADVELLADLDEMAVMGFSGILKVLPRLSRLRKTILKQVISRKTRLAILVDYPGFNLYLAKALKGLRNPPQILYYIAPQVWAWRPGRIKKMRKIIDRMTVVFPFEKELFERENVKVDFVGHPLLDEMTDYLELKPDLTNEQPGQPQEYRTGGGAEKLLALLPGSRIQEVKRHLPIMIKAAWLLKAEMPELAVGIGVAPNLDIRYYKTIIDNCGRLSSGKHDTESIELYDDSRRLIFDADAAAVCSGTATLETTLLGTPQVVVYLTSFLNYQIARRVVRLENIALVNVVAGQRIVPELIQHDLTVESLAGSLRRLLMDHERREEMMRAYEIVSRSLGSGGASRKVAEIALKMLE